MRNVFACLVLAAVFWHCTSDDTGKACTGSVGTYASNTVTDENTSQGLVSVSTDSKCQSFDCITDQGLPSFCSRTCTMSKAAAHAASCTLDSDCSSPAQCYNGVCTDDDCPGGFWCKVVQTVGPLANERFCIQRTGCTNDYDCGHIGVNTCQSLGCYDACDTDTSCTESHRVCVDKSELKCTCNNGSATCPDANLVCTPPGSTTPLAAGDVESLQVCLPKS